MTVRPWKMSRNPMPDFRLVVAGIVAFGAVIGVPIGIGIDVLLKRHRR